MMADYKNGIHSSFAKFLNGKKDSYIGIKKHRSKILLLLGLVLTIAMAIVSLCVGQSCIMSPFDALGCMFSAIAKGGSNLTINEIVVYEDRLPRTLMTIFVGIGLSVSGAAYQAIIRNPLVDPYIMGVSSGAGSFAVSTIAFGFTLFGLLSENSPYYTAISAMIGGLLAFFITMAVAKMAGSSSNSYVLSGVVVGLLFSAIQTVLIKFSNNKVASAMHWLFGSFANVTLTEAVIVVICVTIMVALIMKRAKEFNLVLLGEDQAAQMGLDVKRFNTVMLVIASVLASICVAFVGIIGFVGLVVPHLCRMILGGDHRLVLPASIALGGPLMIAADLIARMALYAQELPVGAITTLIGVPVFAYLLIKRGKMYDG
jgi:iron complex transport system permease protein